MVIEYIAGKHVFYGSCGQHPPEAHQTLIQWAASNRTSYVIDPDDAKNPQSLSNERKSPNPNPINNDDEFEYEDDNPANLSLPGESEDEEEEEDEEDQEDDEDFYTSNPVDSMPSNSNTDDKKFDDFDDFEALGLNGFYGSEHGEQARDETRATQKPNASKQIGPSSRRPHRAPAASSPKGHKMPKSGRAQIPNRGRRRRKYKQGAESSKRKPSRRKKPIRQQQNNLTPRNITHLSSNQQPSNQSELRPGQNSVSDGLNGTMAASDEQLRQYDAPSPYANQCAMVSSISGACVDYQSVEWAIREARRLIAFRRPPGLRSLEPSAASVHSIGELNEWASRLLAMRFGLTSDEVAQSMGQIDVSQTSLWQVCPRLYKSPWARQCFGRQQSGNQLYYQLNSDRVALTSGRYRSVTGQCNNPIVPNLGSSFMPFVRMNTPEYGDGVGSSRRSQSGLTELPPARLVALTLHSDMIDGAPSSDLSALFAAWGQLINHDLAMASSTGMATGHLGSCCKGNLESRQVSSRLGRVCMPIAIGSMDPVYGPYGVRCHDFKRSSAGVRPGCSFGPRTQLNLVTSFIDGSFVYGSTRSQANSLRSRDSDDAHHRGQLKVWDYFGHYQERSRRRRRRQVPSADIGDNPASLKPLLPPQQEDPDDECIGRPEGLFCFLSGDLRTNQQVPLVALHTIHTRQHNRLAQALSELNPLWSSERVYQEARHIHAAQIQHIVMREYLPLILSTKARHKFDLNEANDGNYWNNYEHNLNPGVAQEFAAAAFRQGHSTVASEIYRVDVISRLPKHVYRLRELYRQPWPLFEPGAMDEFLLGLTETASRELDPFVSRELSGHLLQEPNEPIGLDLVAINLQRGRDQGVASYNSMREWCGLGRVHTIDDLVRVVGNQSAHLMMQLYESPDDIDLYSGGLSEIPLEVGGLLGPTFSCIIGHQFGLLRRGDRFWYESSNGPHAFTPQQLASIKQTTLARIICANSDRIWYIQPMAMRLPHSIYNPMIRCQELPELDLSLWVDIAGQQPIAINSGDSE